MFLSGFAINCFLVFFNFVYNILITVPDSIFAKTPERVFTVISCFGKACVSDQTVPLPEIERDIRERKSIVIGEVVYVVALQLRNDRQPASEFCVLNRRPH